MKSFATLFQNYYKFIYAVVTEYLNSFNTYGNFWWSSCGGVQHGHRPCL